MERLEAREVLSGNGPAISSDAFPGAAGAATPETAPLTDWVAPIPTESAADSRQPVTAAQGPIRLVNLQVSPSADWLVKSRRHRLKTATDAGGESDSRNTTPPSDDTRVRESGPACDPASLSLCKVKLDDAVDPIFKCPGLDEAYCLPPRPYRPLNPYADAGDRGPTGTRGAEPGSTHRGVTWLVSGRLKELPWTP